jgi:NADH-quinone oxidoreductase subunit J
MPLWLFFFLATLAVITALGVILQSNPVHCLLGLAVNLLVAGVIFMGLGAVTVGLLQIIIYVGAIMVLFLFVIWLLNLQAESFSGYLGLKFFGATGAAILAAEFAVAFLRGAPAQQAATSSAAYGSIASLGRTLFADYLIGFEITSVLLLAAVVGAIGLARRVPLSAEQAERSGAEQMIPPEASRAPGRRGQIPASIPAPASRGQTTGAPSA